MADKIESSASTAKERPSDFTSEYDYWRTCISLGEKGLKQWTRSAEILTTKFCAKGGVQSESLVDEKQPYHVFYSNINVLQPAVYARIPKVIAKRKFNDRDPLGRLAATIIQRAAQASLDTEDFDPTVKSVRDDWLIRGRGLARETFQPVIGERTDSSGSYPDVLSASASSSYVHWRDFIHPNVRSWAEIQKRWVAFKWLMTREELVAKFGQAGEKVTLDAVPEDVQADSSIDDKEPYKQARIYEIWDAKDRVVRWLSKASDEGGDFLLVEPDPLGLQGFYPCPRPLCGTLSNDDFYPTADYIFYADQAESLNLIQWKIDVLLRAVKQVGARDASAKELDRLLAPDCEFELIPVENWPVFLDKGGLQGAVVWMPIKELVTSLQVLYEAQERTLGRLHEISGLSDTLRGYADPRSTATAERIKARYAEPRLDEKSREMQRFLRDLIRIKAEIIAERFEEQHLAMLAGVDQLSDQDKQLFPQAVQLLKDDRMRTFKVDIETDSTIAEDEQLERQNLGEFLEGASQFMSTALEIGQQQPALTPVLGEMLSMAFRTFRKGNELEPLLEDALKKIAEPKPEQAEPPDPKVIAEQNKAQASAQKMQADAMRAQAELQLKKQELDQQYQIEMNKLQAQMQEAQMKIAGDIQSAVEVAKVKSKADIMKEIVKPAPVQGIPTR